MSQEIPTPTVPTWKREFEERIKAFANATSLSVEKVKEILSGLGVDGQDDRSLTILDSEAFLPIGDLFTAFSDSGLAKKSIIRLGLPHLRGQTWKGSVSDSVGITEALSTIANSTRSKSDWSITELLDAYDDESTEIAEVLRKKTHGRPCIVFNRDGTVNKSISSELIQVAKKQSTSNEYVKSGAAYRVYRAGEFPVRLVDESPCKIGLPLVNGYCSVSGCNWSDISHEARVFARLMIEIDGWQTKLDLKKIFAGAQEGITVLRQNWPDIALRYDEMAEQNKLPTLKVSPNSVVGVKKDTAF